MKDSQPKVIRRRNYAVPPYLFEETDLHVDIHEQSTVVTTSLKVRRNPDADSVQPDLVLNGGQDMETRSVAIDGRELLSNEYGIDDELLTVYSVPESFTLKTRVEIRPQDNSALEGLYQSGDMLCTQCEAEGFRNITWYLDRPDVMSKFSTTIVADKKKYPVLLSNGNDIERGGIKGGEGDSERHWVTWEDPFRKPSYLFALVAGDLEHIEDSFTTMSGREITLKIFTEAHNINKVDYAMASLKNAMAWDERVYGREYDLDIFMIVAVESFNMGAMENKGLNVFNTSCVLARPDTTTDAAYKRVEGVIAHEYFHNWSGNRVTCRDWFQLSLKEGFTVFRDQEFSSDMGSPTVCRVQDVSVLRNTQFPEDAGPMAHPVRPDSYMEINNFYTTTVYEKGAEVVRMIRTLSGKERFRKGTDLYFKRHDGQAVTTEDFVRAIEDANDMDLTRFRTWYRQAGTPVLDISSRYDESEGVLTLTVHQSCPPSPGQKEKGPYHMPLAVGLLDESGSDIQFTVDKPDISSIVADDDAYTVVLNITESSREFTLGGIGQKPVVSLLRGFSAPVKLNYDYTRDELTFLMTHDNDGFARWEAGQRFGVDIIQEVVEQIRSGSEITVDSRLITAFENNLNQAVEHNQDDSLDKAMIAAMLELPTETWLAELADIADVDAIHQAREAVCNEIASRLGGLLLSVYRLNQSRDAYRPETDAIARRSLKNIALGYLMQPVDGKMAPLCVEQIEQADNMTDTSSAIRALTGCAAETAREPAEKALEEFYNRWVDEALVIDQWFTIQASCQLPGALDRVKSLMEHEAFDIRNPNRMRALVNGFTLYNNVNFHSVDGSGYEFLADRVLELDQFNPMVAARILGPLTRWRKFDVQRRTLMTAQLERIKETENLSRDVFEIVSKSLQLPEDNHKAVT